MHHIFQTHHRITSSKIPSETGFIIIFIFETIETQTREIVDQYHVASKWYCQNSIFSSFPLYQGVHSIFDICQYPLSWLLKCSTPFFPMTATSLKVTACPEPFCSYFLLQNANMKFYIVLCYFICYVITVFDLLLFQSLCAQFAIEGLPINQLFGSDSLEDAEREIQYFFPPQHTVALIKPHVTQEQRGKYIKIEPMLLFFSTSAELCKVKKSWKNKAVSTFIIRR